jgi:hypothetical protein
VTTPSIEVHLDADDLARSLRGDVLTGLTATQLLCITFDRRTGF